MGKKTVSEICLTATRKSSGKPAGGKRRKLPDTHAPKKRSSRRPALHLVF